MNLDLPATTLLALLLASARAGGFLAVAPPFNNKAIPVQAKALLSVAIGLPMVAQAGTARLSLDTWAVMSGIVVQARRRALARVPVPPGVRRGAVGRRPDRRLRRFLAGVRLRPADAERQRGVRQDLPDDRLDAAHGVGRVPAGAARVPARLRGDPARRRPRPAHPVGRAHPRPRAPAAGGPADRRPLLCVLFLADVALGLLTRVAPSLNAFQARLPVQDPAVAAAGGHDHHGAAGRRRPPHRHRRQRDDEGSTGGRR
nr:flagellar biosynthetic protein FliR [Angustibacter aerolatus]